jgi:hypothetical protein
LNWLLCEEIKNKKNFPSEELENKFSDSILNCFEDFERKISEFGSGSTVFNLGKMANKENPENSLKSNSHADLNDYAEVKGSDQSDPHVNLDECYCECGKFQENLFPCLHAYKIIKNMNKDPFLYVSSMYSKDKFLKIEDLHPVVNIKVHPNIARVNNKRKKNDQSINQNDSEE